MRSFTEITEEFVDYSKAEYTTGSGDEIFKNPTSRELRDILASVDINFKGMKSIRCIIFPKDIYVWRGNTLHAYVFADLKLSSSGVEGYLGFKNNSQKMYQVQIYVPSSVDVEKFLRKTSNHRWLDLYSTPKTIITDPYGSTEFRIGEEFVDFVEYRNASEELYKNPTTRETKEIMQRAVKHGNEMMLLRCWCGERDILVWEGTDTAHQDVKPKDHITGRSGYNTKFIQIYIVFTTRAASSLKRVSLSIAEPTYLTEKSALESLKHIAGIPWIKSKITSSTEFTTPSNTGQQVLFTGKDL